MDPLTFPVLDYDAGRVLHRIHKAVNTAIYFSGSDAWRWDPPIHARAEYGTCYFGESTLGSYLEVFARTVPVRESLIDERVVSEVHLSPPLRLADLTSPALAGRVGPIPELSVGPSYAESQQLSSILHDAGFDGIRYQARHDPAAASRSIAIFSDASDALTVIKSMPIPTQVIETGEQDYELYVMPDSPLY